MLRRDKCWKDWAEGVRKFLMINRVHETTKSVADIRSESGTSEPMSNLIDRRFWTGFRSGKIHHGAIARQGLEINFELDRAGKVGAVTFRLNETWRGVMERAIQRGL